MQLYHLFATIKEELISQTEQHGKVFDSLEKIINLLPKDIDELTGVKLSNEFFNLLNIISTLTDSTAKMSNVMVDTLKK